MGRLRDEYAYRIVIIGCQNVAEGRRMQSREYATIVHRKDILERFEIGDLTHIQVECSYSVRIAQKSYQTAVVLGRERISNQRTNLQSSQNSQGG